MWLQMNWQVKSREDIAELARQLQSKEGEVADLKRCQQALLGIKNKEIEELKEDKECGAELDKQCAAVKSAKAASVDVSQPSCSQVQSLPCVIQFQFGFV